MSSETEDMRDAVETAMDGAKGTRRVIERAVMVPFDVLPEDLRRAMSGGHAQFVKTWLPVAVGVGKDAEAIDAYADGEVHRPGEYRAIPKTTWDGARGRVIEPELG